MKTPPEVLKPLDRISTPEELYQAIDLLSGLGSSKSETPVQKLNPVEDLEETLSTQSANPWLDAIRVERHLWETEPLAGIFVQKHRPTN